MNDITSFFFSPPGEKDEKRGPNCPPRRTGFDPSIPILYSENKLPASRRPVATPEKRQEPSIRMPLNNIKTIIQCDFDSTIIAEDISFMILDAFADSSWRNFLEEYRVGRMLVGDFNSRSFTMVKADEKTLLDYILVRIGVKIRPGFTELLDYCSGKGFDFVVVSNGLSFYIEAILKNAGLGNIEVHAADTQFSPDGLKVQYIGPDGQEMQDGFKQTYTELFLGRGYRVVYIGDGYSDIIPATHAHHIFARDDLLAHCRQHQIDCFPFDDLHDVVKGLKQLSAV